MRQEIKTITLSLPLKLGSVNCYLIKTDVGHFLIDTGSSNRRTELEKELESAGCIPGYLKLIVLTHGDFDHTGNAAYLRKKFGTRTAIHRDDSGIVERGDMFFNRKRPNALIRKILPSLSGFGRSERFTPDFFVEDGDDLSECGFDARILHIPGHSKGSIGILTAGGDLFCGDLLVNTDKPVPNVLLDDLTTANDSISRLEGLKIDTVYPGHGKSFPMELLTTGSR